MSPALKNLSGMVASARAFDFGRWQGAGSAFVGKGIACKRSLAQILFLLDADTFTVRQTVADRPAQCKSNCVALIQAQRLLLADSVEKVAVESL